MSVISIYLYKENKIEKLAAKLWHEEGYKVGNHIDWNTVDDFTREVYIDLARNKIKEIKL